MDRLIKPDLQLLDLLFTRNQKCSRSFNLTNLMHTMPVAISLTTSNSSFFSFSHSFSIIPPLSTASFTVFLTTPCDQPPLSSPPPTILVRASILPTGKARQEDLRRLFSRPGSHIFKDAVIPIFFTGPDFAEFLLSPLSNSSETNSLFSKAISNCDKSQLTRLLRIAALNGKSELIPSLIRAGADVNNRDPQGKSVMSLAVNSGKIDVVQILIESGFEMDKKFDRFLHDAAATNRVDLIEILCSAYANKHIDLNSTNSQGQTPIHLASIHGHVESLKFLVSLGSDPDLTDLLQWTPLHYAAEEGHLEAVEFLLSCSVFSKHAITKEGKTAFSLVVEKGNSHLYDLLQLGDLLQRAARIDDWNAIKFLLDQGAKANGTDQNGWTALHRAAFKGHLESVKALVRYGATVDLVDGKGYTPFMRAVEAGQVPVAMYLLSHGAKASFKSLEGILPLDPKGFKNYSTTTTATLVNVNQET